MVENIEFVCRYIVPKTSPETNAENITEGWKCTIAKNIADTTTESDLLWRLSSDSITNPRNINSSNTGAKSTAVTIAQKP